MEPQEAAKKALAELYGEKRFSWDWAEQYGLTRAGLDEAKAKALCDWKLATLLLTESRFVNALIAADISLPVATEAYDKIPKAKGNTSAPGGVQQRVGPVKLTIIIDDAATELDFAQPPTVRELFAVFNKELGEAGQDLKLYFRLRDGNYVGVTPRTASLSWDMYDFHGDVCFARVARKTPPPSPERPTVRPPHEADRAVAGLAAKLAMLSMESTSAKHLDMTPPTHLDMTPPTLPVSGSPSLENLGLCFPEVELDALRDKLITHIHGSWKVYPAAPGSSAGAARNACVLVAGGASGTGKTRFGAALPRVLLAAAQRCPETPKALITALEECATRQLVLQISQPSRTDLADRLVSVYLSPPITASTPRFKGITEDFFKSLLGRTLTEVWRRIAEQERNWRPLAGPLAVIVHLDEVQGLYSGNLDKATVLGDMVRELAEQVWNQPAHVALFPIFYVSGLNKTMVLRSASSPIPVSLPLLTAEHYTSILRRLFGLGEHWNPPAPLARALRCIEGPPRLLLTFLWAVQASGTPHAAAATPPSASAATAAYDAMFTTDIDCELLRPKLSSFSWPQSVAVLNRCLGALDHSRLVTFTDKIKHGSDCLELFHNIAALFLLSQPVSLDTKLDTSITVNDVIADGFAVVQPIEGQKGMHLLRWPRIYIWALAKWCGSKIDGLPLPAAAAALTPSPRMNDAEEAWRYNEDADIKLLCLRLFAHQQRACTLPAQVGGVVRLGELLPCLADHAPALAELVVRLATRHVVRAEKLSEPLRSDTLLELLAQSSTILPFAAINKDKTPYADSILLLQLDTPAPRACCPSKIAAGDRLERQYKEIAPQHQKTLAVLLQSKHHSGFPTRSEAFGEEYAKCIDTPIPFVFILISDAPNVAYQQHINWPYNGNGFFVGRNELRHFYGEVLFGIRAESWLAKDTP